jgi:hypothetical protein
LERFNWKFIAGLAFGLLTLAMILLFGFGADKTPLTTPNQGDPVKIENARVTTGHDSSGLSIRAGADHFNDDDSKKGRTLSGRPESRAPETETGSDQRGVPLFADRTLIWPEGVGPENLPPWLRDRPEEYLEEIEEARDETPSKQRTPENHTVLFVGAQPDLITGYPYSDEVFDPSVTRLYAWFPCDTAAFSERTKVLAKWTYEDKTEILFEGMSILNSTPYNYIWREDSFWSPGRYSMELYGLEEDIPLLAWGAFEIADLGEHTGFAGLYADPADQVSRQSFYLEEEIYLRVSYSSTQERQIQVLITSVADGTIMKGGVVTFPPGTDRDFTVDLTVPPYPFQPGSYILQLFSYPEPHYLTGRNIFNILD